MHNISVNELGNHLGTYLAFARSGETIVINEESLPFAKIVPITPGNSGVQTGRWSEEDLELAGAGLMILPEGEWDVEEFLSLPDAPVTGDAGTDAILAEREEGW